MSSKEDKHRLALEYFEKAYDLHLNGHLDKAAVFFKKSIQAEASADAYTYLGWIYAQKGFYEKAIEYCLKAIEIEPDYSDPYNDIGAYLIKLKKYDEAVVWLEKALSATKYGNYAYAFINLGYIYEIKGNWAKALQYYEKSLEARPDNEAARTAIDRLKGKFN